MVNPMKKCLHLVTLFSIGSIMKRAKTMGERISTKRFRRNAQSSKSAAVTTVKVMALVMESDPVTSPHFLLRGLITSYFLPSSLLIDIPVALASVPARITRMMILVPGYFPAAMKLPATIKGISKTVCSSFM